jgi:hypothetical protein
MTASTGPPDNGAGAKLTGDLGAGRVEGAGGSIDVSTVAVATDDAEPCAMCPLCPCGFPCCRVDNQAVAV